MQVKIAGILVGSLLLSGCAIFVGSTKWFEKHGRPQLEQKAAFDFDCPTEELEVNTFGTKTSAGVKGCGKRARYEYIDGTGWIGDIASSDTERDEIQALDVPPDDAEPEESAE